MKFVFFGTPAFAADILTKLLTDKAIPVAVVCNPDRPVGARRVITAPPTKQIVGMREDILLLQPERPSEIVDKLKSLKPDLFIVAAYTHILKKDILSLPRLGTVGVHPSLLPKYRGSTPIQSVLLAGEATTGVSLYKMDEKMDHGPIYAQGKLPIEEHETYRSLEKKLAALAGDMLVALLPKLEKNKVTPQEQNHAQATFTKKFETKDAEVDMLTDSPETIYRKIRALNPEPGVYTINFAGREGKRVKLLSAQWSAEHPEQREGSITPTLKITMIQPDGKKPFRL